MNAIDGMACLTPGCDSGGKPGLNIVGHGSFATKSGRRRRYRCTVCRGTLSTNTGTAYSGLRCTRREFDQVASLRVEGVGISATARVTGHSRTTIARWLARASTAAKHFNYRMLRDFDLIELQADELCTFIGNKSKACWLFVTIEVSSRLWASSHVGRRSSRNTAAVLNDVILRGRLTGCPLLATDGFAYYFAAIRRLIGPVYVYGQVIKTRRNDRVVRVERRVKDRYREAADGRAAAVGGFRAPEHVVRGAPQPHHSSRLSVPAPSIAVPCPMRRAAPRARGALALSLQLRTAAPGIEVRARDQDAGDAGRCGQHATDLEPHLHGARSLSTHSCGDRAHSRDRPPQRNWHSPAADVLVAARPTNRGLINSEWRKHPEYGVTYLSGRT